MATIKVLQISFNVDDPLQKKLYEFAKSQSTNFSFYGKSLVQKDMQNNWNNPSHDGIEDIRLDTDILQNFI